MRIIEKLLAIMLMSMVASVALAQAPKRSEVANLVPSDVVRIEDALSDNPAINQADSVVVVSLLLRNNMPIRGFVAEDGEYFSKTKKGDMWIAYISRQHGTLWLSYVISRKEKFIGRVDLRLR